MSTFQPDSIHVSLSCTAVATGIVAILATLVFRYYMRRTAVFLRVYQSSSITGDAICSLGHSVAGNTTHAMSLRDIVESRVPSLFGEQAAFIPNFWLRS